MPKSLQNAASSAADPLRDAANEETNLLRVQVRELGASTERLRVQKATLTRELADALA